MANDKRDILRKAAIAKFEADEGLKPNGNDVIARADRMSMIAFGRGFDAGHAAATAEGIPQADGWGAIETVEDLPKDGLYLLTLANGTVCDSSGFTGFSPNVIAYRPMPAPYQRQSREGE